MPKPKRGLAFVLAYHVDHPSIHGSQVGTIVGAGAKELFRAYSEPMPRIEGEMG